MFVSITVFLSVNSKPFKNVCDSRLRIGNQMEQSHRGIQLKRSMSILVEAILQLKEPCLLSQKQGDEGPRPPDQALLFF